MPAHLLVESMYKAINRRDVAAAINFVDDDCIYEDLNFPQPFRGKEAVKQLFEESCQGLPDDLQFVIDEITVGDPFAAGVLWHVELDGIPFPNARGVSFYRLSEKTGKLIFARDLVEPPVKLGKAAFWIIRLVTPLVRRLLKSQKSNSEKLRLSSPQATEVEPNQRRLSVLLWILSAAYIYILLLSPPGQIVPGEPAWAIQPETLQEIFDESLNFFFVLPVLNAVGINYLNSPTIHPVIEALFNFAEAWIFMFLPLMLIDQRAGNLPKLPIWSMAMFLTNGIICPYMALRQYNPLPQPQNKTQKSWLAPVFGWIGLIVGTIALAWGFVGRPEFGDLAQRGQYFGEQLLTNRVTLAFCIDLVLFSIFQAVLLRAVNPSQSKRRWLSYIPFWGLAAWLIMPPGSGAGDSPA
ncbi:MAG: nuclear transport factor 2 family protein [Symploca sp. SIO3C6]|nr:nuclear transport factor 2 family protein [Symploca sp. SIO3C6]